MIVSESTHTQKSGKETPSFYSKDTNMVVDATHVKKKSERHIHIKQSSLKQYKHVNG